MYRHDLLLHLIGFHFYVSYSNILVVELNQLYYGGLLRCIALSSTDGLCSWRCLNILIFQPVIVFIGRLAVGRILNVVGSVIDWYIDLSTSFSFNTYCFVESDLFLRSCSVLGFNLWYLHWSSNIKLLYLFLEYSKIYCTLPCISSCLTSWIYYTSYLNYKSICSECIISYSISYWYLISSYTFILYLSLVTHTIHIRSVYIIHFLLFMHLVVYIEQSQFNIVCVSDIYTYNTCIYYGT